MKLLIILQAILVIALLLIGFGVISNPIVVAILYTLNTVVLFTILILVMRRKREKKDSNSHIIDEVK